MEYILGAVVSLIIQGMKKKFKGDVFAMSIIILSMSVVFAGIYTVLVHTDLWPTIVTVLTTAGAFYAFVIRRFEDD